MQINHVQELLIGELLEYAQIKYPEISLKEIRESPSGENHVWVIVKGINWQDDDRIMDFTEYASLKQEDILIDYGYPISLIPDDQ